MALFFFCKNYSFSDYLYQILFARSAKGLGMAGGRKAVSVPAEISAGIVLVLDGAA